jgi:DNA-binding XRE family transcriptional regulator
MIYKVLLLNNMEYHDIIENDVLREYREATTMAVVTIGRTPLAERLILERAARDWSQAELAERAGVSPSTVALAETSSTTTSPRTLYRIARALELNPIELLRLPQGEQE